MKRLLSLLVSSIAISTLFLSSSVSAATRYWKIDMYQPAATTNKTLRVEYKVLSTIATDTFTIELFENNVSKGSQFVAHSDGNYAGDSGVFTVPIPAAGTYSYKILATNHGAGNETKTSDTKSVQVSDAPNPTVTTVTVTQNTTPTAQTAAANTAGGQGGGGAEAAGQVAAATTAAGTTAPGEAATTTTGTNGTDNTGSSVLGAEATAAKTKAVNRTGRNIALGSAGIIIVAAIAYAIYRRRALG